MKQKQNSRILLAVLLAGILTLTGCKSSAQTDPAESTASTVTTATTASVSTDLLDLEFTARDLDVGYDEAGSAQIALNDANTTVSGTGASYADGVLTITAEGTYILTGSLSDGQIVVDAPDTAKVQLVFNGLSIHCEDQACLWIKQADKVFVTLAEGSQNSLSDSGTDYVQTDADSTVDGVIFSKADLTINGSGALSVTANYQHGIVSKDDLVITGGTISVTANGQGLSGKDCVKIKDGTFTLTTQGDGIHSSNAEDETKGFVYLCGGTYTINAQTDAVQAETILRIDDINLNATTGGGSANTSTKSSADDMQGGWGRWGNSGKDATQQSTQTITTDDTTAESTSAKGLKAGSGLLISGGTLTIDSSDDSVHCNGSAEIAGGTLNLSSGDDGIHADAALVIQDGMIAITKSYEGLEGASITMNGGTVELVASDDGLNAAGGSDSSSMGGRPGENSFDTDSDVFIQINGGILTVDASGDGLDSNGNLTIAGGTVYVNGPTSGGDGALDYNGTGIVTGGTVVAVGSSAMAQGFSDSSTQYSILQNFSSSISAGETLTLTDADGNKILSFTPEKAYQSVVITSPKLQQGATYTLTAGSQSEELTLNSVVTSNGSSGMGGFGGGMGGQKGGMTDGQLPEGDPPDGNMPEISGDGEMPTPPDSGQMPGKPGDSTTSETTSSAQTGNTV